MRAAPRSLQDSLPGFSGILLNTLSSLLFFAILSPFAPAQSGQWAWMVGSEKAGQPGVYGKLGAWDAANTPGARYQAVSFPGPGGRIYLFGGYGIDSKNDYGDLNDLWEFDPVRGAHGEWVWLAGNNLLYKPYKDQPGVYGNKGQFADGNTPGGRRAAVGWTDKNGKLWLFGGWGVDSTGNFFALNDLWEFDPARGKSGQWAWMGGPKTYTSPKVAGFYGGQGVFGPNYTPGGRSEAVSWTDASGRLWLFGGEGYDGDGNSGALNDLWVFDSAKGTAGEWAWMGGSKSMAGTDFGAPGVYGTQGQFGAANVPGARALALAWAEPGGRLWLFGGAGKDSADKNGLLDDLWVFDSALGSYGEWAWMAGLSSLGGVCPGTSMSCGPPGVYGTLGKFAAANVPGGRDAAATWVDSSGSLWFEGGWGIDQTGYEAYLNDVWEFRPLIGAHGQWAWMGGATTVPHCTMGAGMCGIGGQYGTLGSFSSANLPGSRAGGSAWTDSRGLAWVFGGSGYDYQRNYANLNDMWAFQPPASLKSQTINFPQPASPVTYGVKPVTLSATASSGLAVTFSVVSGPGKVSGTSGSTLTITGAGTIVVAANQAGNSTYYPAPQVTRSIIVAKAALTVAADAKTMPQNGSVPTLTYAITGFVNGDAAANTVTGKPKLSTNATSSCPAGLYSITVDMGTLASANYSFTLKGATLKVIGRLAWPTFKPPAGTYTGAQTVALSSVSPGVAVYYTADGSTPSSTHGTRYTTAIHVNKSETVKAIAVLAGCTDSWVNSATYTIH
ncbi:MAG: chitobiase/beta-hexosaminidase C-terminal domain-containing protein [Terracidiphilus sp.]